MDVPNYDFIAHPANPMTALKDMLDVQSHQNSLQAQRIENEANQKKLNEVNHIRQVMGNIDQYRLPDGQVDNERLKVDLYKGAGTQGAEAFNHYQETTAHFAQGQAAMLGLNDAQKGAVGQVIQSTIGLPFDKRKEVLDMAIKTAPQLKPVLDSWMPVLDKVKGDQTALDATSQMLAKSTQSVPAQNQLNTPNILTVNNGAATLGYQQNPSAPNPNRQILNVSNQLGPDQRETVTYDSLGNPVVSVKNPQGQIVEIKGAPIQGQRTQAPIYPQSQTQETQKALLNEPLIAAKSIENAPQIIYFANQTQDMLDAAKKSGGLDPTGNNADFIAKVGSFVGSPGLFRTNAEATQKLAHNLVALSMNAEKDMGVSTDMGRINSELANGSINTTPEVLDKIVQETKALTTGKMLYSQAIQNAKNLGNQSPQAIMRIKANWPFVFSMDAMKIASARNKNELDGVIEGLGGRNSDRFKDAGRKYDAMRSLVGE